jgi:hypothetical protein
LIRFIFFPNSTKKPFSTVFLTSHSITNKKNPLEVNNSAQEIENEGIEESPKIQVEEIEEDEGIDDDDDEEKALVENEIEQTLDDDNTLDTTTNTNTTENTTTTIVNDSDPGSERWKEER